MIKHLLCQCCYLSKGNTFEPLRSELSPFEYYTITKNVKNYTKIYKFCNIIVEGRWNKFFLNLKYSNILSHCCYLSKGYSFESLMAEWSPFESYTIYKKRDNSIKICKFCNIIVEAKWDKFWLNLMYSNILIQCWYLSKSNSFEPLMAELSPLESYTIYKKRDNSTKICNFATSL